MNILSDMVMPADIAAQNSVREKAMHGWLRTVIICSVTALTGCQTINDVSSQMGDLFSSLTSEDQPAGTPAPTDRKATAAASVIEPRMLSGTIRPELVYSGDSFTLDGSEVSLFGIDALEALQTCGKEEQDLPCGEMARNALIGFTAGQTVTCIPVYNSSAEKAWISQCTVGDFNLSSAMIQSGFATISKDPSLILSDQQALARQQKRGMWGTRFEMPASWRSMHPTAIFSPRQN
ncbi:MULTISPECIES: thermonuclease family protein [Thalassospira]|uniref:thermonuclease family protein n=1 Tax=Thalassospira TaxID=168934 RepID=UPI000C482977|nr:MULTISPECIES: thermonuclease family protein [Thalassospira]MAB33472.1 hypothetical protein [Thalassospira sp.]HBS22804.1 hypothetical protein [Thalassospira sp.]|tara:strand:+ start:288 stop:992 length:705 start_codon:yes stop_codon:yes gene_type:complete